MKKIDFKVLLPNVITLSGLSFGLSSIRFALEQDFNLAILCILIAGLCDVLDGMLARHLNSESDLGAQLDSLSGLKARNRIPCRRSRSSRRQSHVSNN